MPHVRTSVRGPKTMGEAFRQLFTPRPAPLHLPHLSFLAGEQNNFVLVPGRSTEATANPSLKGTGRYMTQGHLELVARRFCALSPSHSRVPHISLVFREMWDTTCPMLAPAYVGRKRWAKPFDSLSFQTTASGSALSSHNPISRRKHLLIHFRAL